MQDYSGQPEHFQRYRNCSTTCPLFDLVVINSLYSQKNLLVRAYVSHLIHNELLGFVLYVDIVLLTHVSLVRLNKFFYSITFFVCFLPTAT